MEDKLKCLVYGKEIENEEESILFCRNECRRRYRPNEKGDHQEL